MNNHGIFSDYDPSSFLKNLCVARETGAGPEAECEGGNPFLMISKPADA